MIALYALADIGHSLNVGLPIKSTIGTCVQWFASNDLIAFSGSLRNAGANW